MAGNLRGRTLTFKFLFGVAIVCIPISVLVVQAMQINVAHSNPQEADTTLLENQHLWLPDSVNFWTLLCQATL